MRNPAFILFTLILLVSGATLARAEYDDSGWKAVGVHAGLSATEKHQYFHRFDIFANYGLPWSLRGERGWGAAMQLNMAAGMVRGGGESGFIGAVGPSVVFDKAGNRGIMFELGGDLDVLSRQVFGRQDFNGNLLFEGYAALIYRFDNGIGIGYRFQHMSNGGIYSNGSGNPGLDLHTVSLSYHF
ncbi:acyloxyacyl hydrolase [Geomesophilobacter sediminis]|uniref:Acyloxyacyl hydrolase n=1 Tax=Geomesophilobacter sediminis TaxID=2798584 RepID=A0A8J7LYR7_9BACT|nr:acyloxyacyl hydrolase [Geomesophilobacter sediminis]MBJ6725317.1 acyloxyacyl hydrolase [Geomesophilobacter sediminis]